MRNTRLLRRPALVAAAVVAGKHITVRLPAVPQPSAANGSASVFLFGLGYGVASLS